MTKQASANDTATAASVKIPDILGIKKMTPLEMNAVRFDKKHTVLTPELMASMSTKK